MLGACGRRRSRCVRPARRRRGRGSTGRTRSRSGTGPPSHTWPGRPRTRRSAARRPRDGDEIIGRNARAVTVEDQGSDARLFRPRPSRVRALDKLTRYRTDHDARHEIRRAPAAPGSAGCEIRTNYAGKCGMRTRVGRSRAVDRAPLYKRRFTGVRRRLT